MQIDTNNKCELKMARIANSRQRGASKNFF